MRFIPVTPMLLIALAALLLNPLHSGAQETRRLSGVVVSHTNQGIPGVAIKALVGPAEFTALSDSAGRFSTDVPRGPLVLRVEGKNIQALQLVLGEAETSEGLRIEVGFVVPPVHNTIVIVASALDPGIDRRNEAVYRDTLFSRDDQVLHTLHAGINAGQHEGGGKSVEVRRFGFNLDHGGVSGGLKVLIDGIQQNQGTQGHGQGYLGQLKSLTPELVEEVDIVNGPFSAEYGDFSGLGVVHIRLKESLADRVVARIQAGSFNTFRTFVGYSPEWERGSSFLAYESSRTDGPFQNPLGYARDNLTGNATYKLSPTRSLGLKISAGLNSFASSGQIPLDEIGAGRLDRFGLIDPSNGGRTRSGVLGIYFRNEDRSGGALKIDGFLARSLFDLYSNFTFFLNDEINGDAIQQHDSRLQKGLNVQYLRPFKFFGRRALLVAGSNFHDNQINVGLYPQIGRNPTGVTTRANAHVANVAGYIQQGVDLLDGRLHLEGGLRNDYFNFDVKDRVVARLSGREGSSRFQPKAALAYTPIRRFPLRVHANYGRGISSQDARGIVQRPDSPRLSTTDFYQSGATMNFRSLSLSTDLFLIDRSNEQVYIPDDGSIEFKGPSRAYGYEARMSIQISRNLTLNGGLTKVTNAFYRGTSPRVFVDSAPHAVADGALTLSRWRGFSGSLRLRYINSYRLDGENPAIRAAGHSVVDLSVVRSIHRRVDFSLAVDNLADREYYETQNYFESRIRPGDAATARIHGTPGYPRAFTAGLTFHLAEK
jgi:hypothetical protein